WPSRFDVTVPGDRRPTGIKTHRTTLHRHDLTRQYGIRVTTPARTFLDVAPTLDDRRLTRAVNDALLSKHLSRSQLAETLARNPTHRSTPRLEPFVTTADGPTRSPFEDDFLAFCEHFG